MHQANEIFPDIYFQYYSDYFTIMGLSDLEIWFGTADEFVGGYLVCWHVAASGRRVHAMLPPGYVLGATCPIPSPMYPYRPGGTGFPAQHPPIHAIFLALRGRFIMSLGRFCIGEALATEWPFDDAPVPWILPEGYRHPKGTLLDFPGRDSQDEDSPEKGSGAAPMTVPETVGGMAQDDAHDEDDEGFETVDDDKEVRGDQVLVSISAEKVSKPEDSGLDGKGKMFESEEDDDPEVQEQIKTVLASSGLLGDLQLSESKDESESDSPGGDDDEGDPNETKQYYKDEEDEVTKDSGLKPDSSTTAVTDPPTMPGNPGNPDGFDPGAPDKDTQTTKPIPSKGKGPNSESSSKAPASKSGSTTQPSAVAQGVQEHAQSTLLAAATLAKATVTEEDTVRRLENYTGLLMGLQNLVITMASGYKAAMEDIRSLVASTLDVATQRDRAFAAGASQALANWTEKYQQAMSQAENQSLHNQLARWDQVPKAGITLSQKITSLTADYEPGTVSSEIFRALLPDCFSHIRFQTEAMFHELHATLPTLLCRFIAPDQAGQMLSAIFTWMCNYNTEMCGMAMAQAVVPVYTIPNTYWVQQSLWESICRIIPGIARTSRSELRPFEPAAPRNTPVEQIVTVPAAGNTGIPKVGTAKPNDPESSAASSFTRKKNATWEVCQTKVPLGILPPGSVWVPKEAFQHIPTVNLVDDGDPPGTRPQKTSTPIKATPAAYRSHSGKKLDISKIKGAHLLFKMQDRQGKAWGRESEAKDQAAASHWVAGGERGSSGDLPPGLPARLPTLSDGDGTLTKPTDPATEASSQGKKCPLDADSEIELELLDQDGATGPPKKKKKKKNKSKDKSKDETPLPEAQDDGAHASNTTAEPEVMAEEHVPVTTASGTPAEGTKVSKKKKKKSAALEKFRLEQREPKAKEMAQAKHQKLQRDQDFKALRNYWKSLPADLLDTINGADHSGFLLGRLQKEGNYMSKKSGRERNLMLVDRLLSWIAKYANEPEKRLKEAHQMTKATFPMVQGMPSGDKCTLALVIRVLMDCDCDHSEYGKEQNIGLHDVVSLAAMARVTATETYVVDGVPTMVKADYAYCPFCSYACLNHRAINNHVRMHF